MDSALGHLVFSVKYDVIGDQEHLRLLFRYFKHTHSRLFPDEKCFAFMFWILSYVSLILLSQIIFSWNTLRYISKLLMYCILNIHKSHKMCISVSQKKLSFPFNATSLHSIYNTASFLLLSILNSDLNGAQPGSRNVRIHSPLLHILSKLVWLKCSKYAAGTQGHIYSFITHSLSWGPLMMGIGTIGRVHVRKKLI